MRRCGASVWRARSPRFALWRRRVLSNGHLALFSLARRRKARAKEAAAVRRFARDGLPMVFPPVFELQGGNRGAVEALARFPGNPSQPPSVWFDRAEELSLLVELELACVRS